MYSIVTPPQINISFIFENWYLEDDPKSCWNGPFFKEVLSFCWEYVEFMISLNMKGFNGNLVDLKKSTWVFA